MDKQAKILVAGHSGLVGSAITRKLGREGYDNLVLCDHNTVNLVDRVNVENLFEKHRPEYVFLAAAKVGGILANNVFPADFIFVNLSIQTNIIDCAYRFKVKKLLFLGSSCIYPRDIQEALEERHILTGPLEKTNEPYAVAKIAGIIMCQSYNRQYHTNFISVMPTNLCGPNDNFDLQSSHVVAALIRKFHEAKIKEQKSVDIWGSGIPRREFLYVDDLADALLFLMNNYNNSEIINVGTGKDISIKDLAFLIKEIVAFNGKVVFDKSRLDGTLLKRLDIHKIKALGWEAKTSLREAIKQSYEWFLSSY